MKRKTIQSFSASGFAAACLITTSALAAPLMIKMMDDGMVNHAKMMKTSATKTAPTIKSGDLTISSPVARMSFGRAVNSAGFMTITNTGKRDDVLIGASSTISKRTELHTHIRDGDIMRMRRVEGGIKVPKSGVAKLQPGSFHIMFIGLEKPLKNGDSFPLTLTFQKAGKVMLTMTARKKIPRGAPVNGGMKMNHDHRGSH